MEVKPNRYIAPSMTVVIDSGDAIAERHVGRKFTVEFDSCHSQSTEQDWAEVNSVFDAVHLLLMSTNTPHVQVGNVLEI